MVGDGEDDHDDDVVPEYDEILNDGDDDHGGDVYSERRRHCRKMPQAHAPLF